ncbi:MAG: site-2 protease family protein [archaeon YNP-LCB-003-016]|uniref:site-2 protease family protein n=1 Tax=Candidatus Culexarchaeum yellowstonense TaxID=2928963 RepID=UPI0026F3483D|nr:site-2 protease family protein [Candidatus Culexarchaeum yellowstonense]MCR6691738.1 site-2 protease family protein [Candidatus Culexarchaeum yellowstonense]
MAESMVDVTSIEALVRRFFNVEDFSIQFGVPTFIISPTPDLKLKFKSLYDCMKGSGYLPILRKHDGKIFLRVFRFEGGFGGSNRIAAIVLFLATLATITYSGYLQVTSLSFDIVDPKRNVPLNIALYVLCLLAVAGLHEFGHKIASKVHDVETSFPYFIPGPPEIGGTMGAIIVQRSPMVNRDQLFDVGLSGPLIGFSAAVLVSILGLRLSYIIPKGMIYGVYIPVPAIFDFLVQVFRPSDFAKYDLLLHPVAFAGWIGFLVTFINLMPISQLDGGHVSRAIFGEKYYKVIAYIGVLILMFSGFLLMALLALFMQIYRGHPGPLDDVSPLSFKRRVLGLILVPAIILLCFTSFYY